MCAEYLIGAFYILLLIELVRKLCAEEPDDNY